MFREGDKNEFEASCRTLSLAPDMALHDHRVRFFVFSHARVRPLTYGSRCALRGCLSIYYAGMLRTGVT
jgi:hypothetical protein